MLVFYAMIDNESDKEKFDQIYEQYKHLVFYIANEKLQDVHLSEDVVQDTFLRIAQKMELFESVHSTKTKNLIARIALGKAIDLIRLRKNIHLEDNDFIFVADNVESQNSHPLEQLIHRENYEELLCTISKMEETDKTALQLKYIYGYSVVEAAAILGISYKAATNRLYRAKKKLSNTLTSNLKEAGR